MTSATEIIKKYNISSSSGKMVSGLYNLSKAVLDTPTNIQPDAIQKTNPKLLPNINEFKFNNSCVKYISEVLEVKTKVSEINYGDLLSFTLPQYNHYYHDICAEIEIDAIGNKSGNARTDLCYFYCDFPGIRLFRETTFKWNQLEYEKYTQISAMLHRRFNVPEDSRRSFDLSVGQEVEEDGYIYYPDLQMRQKVKVLNGPQTKKTYQPKLILHVPLIFSFCNDIKNIFNIREDGINNTAIVEIQLENLNKILFSYNPVTNVQTPITNEQGPKILSFKLYLTTLNLPIENPNTVLNKFSLRFIHRTLHIRNVYQMIIGQNRVHLIDVRNLLTHIFFGFRSLTNDGPDNWHMFGFTERQNQIIPVALKDLDNNTAPYLLAQDNISYIKRSHYIDKLKFTLNNTDITVLRNAQYYSNYVSTKQTTAQSPEDNYLYSYYVGEVSGKSCERSILDLTLSNNLYLEWESSINDTVEIIFCANIYKPLVNNINKINI